MILRRITEHVKTQNWFAVCIDFLIVVIGVFIGIQVTNLNEQWKEQSLEGVYLERMQVDIQRSSDRMKSNNDRIKANVYKLNTAINSLDACELMPEDKEDFVKGLAFMGQFEQVYFDDSALEEMKATGRLALIKNNELLDALAEIDRHVSYQQDSKSQITAAIYPHVNYVQQRVRFDITSDEFLTTEALLVAAAKYDFNALCENPVFIASVSSVRFTMFSVLEWNQRIINKIDAVLLLIDAEIAQKTDA